MTQINLVPWREEARQAKKVEFGILLASAVGIAIVAVIILHLYMRMLINHQNRRDTYLQTELSSEQGKLTSLNEGKKQKTEIESSLQFLFSLRKESYQAANVVEALAKITPEGIYFNKITRKGDKLTIIGRAVSNMQITLLMKNIANVAFFQQPELTEISAKEATTGEERIFQLTIELNK